MPHAPRRRPLAASRSDEAAARRPRPRRALVLEHVEVDPAGVYAEALAARGIELGVVRADREPLPSLDRHDLVVSMGGPQSAYDDAGEPWLAYPGVLEAVDHHLPDGGADGFLTAYGAALPRLRRAALSLTDAWLEAAAGGGGSPRPGRSRPRCTDSSAR